MRDFVAGWIAARTGVDEVDIHDDAPFAAYGLTSVDLAALAADTGGFIGRTVPIAALFEHPSLGAFTQFLAAGAPESAPARPVVSAVWHEPLAIVGVACRVPGASDPEAFWRLLRAGADAVHEVPPSRWDTERYFSAEPGAPGRTVSKWGGYLDDLDLFDPSAFGISMAEAERMDPQQRLLLEVCAEAMEDACWTPGELRGTATGVFIGISVNEYGRRQAADPAGIDATMSTGNALSVSANRLSYVFDLRGPSVAVDTACSSSLVATHLAVRAVRSGECDRAVVAGVNALLDPELSIALSRAGMLSPTGRCKAFDARADGYVRGEGCVVLAITSLSGARERGERVYALIRGSAVNSDGRTNGLTAPNPAAQQEVLRGAYADAGVDPAAVGYVECHGTGTPLGDPLEVTALGAVVGVAAAAPCLIGSVKSNIGHLESAAGLAGLLKAALAAHHGEVPPTVHLTEPNPELPLAGTRLRLADRLGPWPGDGPRYAGVSSFGFGGTNAHVVLEGLPAKQAEPAGPGLVVLPLSARSPAALAELAGRWADRLESGAAGDLAGAAYTAAVRRAHHPYRLAVVGRRPEDMAGRLRRWLADGGARQSRRAVRSPRVAFVFSGQGAQYPRMAAGLIPDPLFGSVLRRCDEAAAAPGGPVTALLTDDAAPLAKTENAQPGIFAVQSALAALLRAYGIEPAATVGHSVGEIAAAQVAGRFSLADGMRIAVLRGRAMAGCEGAGRMLATPLSRAEAEEIAVAGGAYVAAVNGPHRTVLSGDADALDKLRADLERSGRPGSWLPGGYPFHCPLLRADVRSAVEAAVISPRDGDVPWYSTVTGGPADGLVPDAAYWERNAREPVRFADAVVAMAEDGIDAFVELGPQPTLLSAIRENARTTALAPLKRGADDVEGLLRTLGALYELGCDVRWARLWPEPPEVVSVPARPWDHRRCWIERPAPGRTAPGTGLLGARIDLAAGNTVVWERELGLDVAPHLADHRVAGAPVLPGTAYLELAVAAAREHGLGGSITVQNLDIHRALTLRPGRRLVQISWSGDGRVVVHSRPADASGDWTEHATARVSAATDPPPAAMPVPDRLAELSTAEFYQAMAGHGLDYGPAFRRLRDIRRADGAATARVTPAPGSESALTAAVMDACVQLTAAALPRLDEPIPAWLFTGVGEIRLTTDAAGGPRQVRVGRLTERPGSIQADAQLLDETGVVLADLRGIRLRRATPAPAERAEPVWLYEPVWRAVGSPDGLPAGPSGGPPDTAAPSAERGWLLMADETGLADRLAGLLATAGETCVVARHGGDYAWSAPGEVTFDPERPEDYRRLLADLPATPATRYTVVELRGIGADPIGSEPVEAALALVQALSTAAATTIRELAVVTAGAQAVHEPDEVRAPGSAGLWGLARALSFENPGLRWKCVDLSPADDDPAGLLAELRSPAGDEAEVALRGHGRFVRRIVPMRVARTGEAPVRSAGGYVITGGLGDLGLVMARWLIDRGATAIALIGRSAPSAAAEQAVAALRASGDVLVLQADVTVREQIATALATARQRFGGLRGVVHAAGDLRDGAMLSMPAEDVRSVFAPKALGAWLVHECCAGDDLDWFVCFSSAAALLGSPGQANYCAANAAMDAFVQYRRGLGKRTITVDWGPWAEVGMAARLSHGERTLRTAVGTINPNLGSAITERLLAADHAHAMALGYDFRHLVQYHPGGPGLSLFAELVGEDSELLPSAGAGPAAVPRPDLPRPYVEPRNDLERRIANLWQSAIGLDAVGVHDAFFELGGDSVIGNQLLVQINRTFGITVDAKEAFGSFTVAGLAELVEAEMIKHLDTLTEQQARDAAAKP
ncbi:MAG TPA: SDR family NAD(P)-dependent oxidoreductase [Streptosporangiaceae bacterium]|nr:SDR family NAD(P)-dependent oxidoreductase [Streptosporangiaceae bacterium]